MTYVDLDAIERIRVAPRSLEQTRAALREWGLRGQEARVLWGGRLVSPRELALTHVIVPRQTNSAFTTHVSGEEIARITEHLFNEKVFLFAQVHTHPADAFHSAEDDEYPICTQQGALSIVIPNFAREPLKDLSACAIFRLTEKGWDGPLPAVRSRIFVEGDAAP